VRKAYYATVTGKGAVQYCSMFTPLHVNFHVLWMCLDQLNNVALVGNSDGFDGVCW
jgi:hypothetical protein